MRARGFALVELLTTLLIAACVIAAVLLIGNAQRRHGRLGEDIAKLRAIGALTAQYGADNADRLWTFSWKKNQALSQYPDLNNAPTDMQACANQAVDILRRVAGRTDLPAIINWIPHLNYSHLALLDYVQKAPDETFLSAGDSHRLKWSRDPAGFDAGRYAPAPSGAPGTPQGKRWPYSASFQMPVCFFDQSAPADRITQNTNQNLFLTPANVVLGGQRLPDVAFPSHKVHLHDSHARHFGTKQPYCTHNEARLPLLFADGAVSVNVGAASNTGWQPNTPTNPLGSQFSYQPDVWEPVTFSGAATELVSGRFRWTRGGVGVNGHVGRDFGGPETCSGQSGCP